MSRMLMTSKNQLPYPAADADRWSLGIGQAVVRHLGLVTLVTIAGIGAALAYVRFSVPLYTSTAQLLVEPVRPKLLGETPPAPSTDEVAAFLSTQRSLISSVPVVMRAVETMKAGPGAGATKDTVNQLRRKLRVSIGRKDNMISVEYDAPTAVQAAGVVAAVVEAYREFLSGEQRTTSTALLRVLEKGRTDCEQAMTRTRAAMLELRRAAGTVSFEGGDGSAVRTLQNMKDALAAAHLDAQNAREAYSEAEDACRGNAEQMRQIAEVERSGSGAVSGDTDVRQIRLAIADLEQQRQDLLGSSGRFLAHHPRIIAYDARIARLRAILVVSLKLRAEALKTNEERLVEAVARQEGVARQYTEQAARNASLDAELKQLEKQADAIDQRIAEVKASRDAGGMNLRVLGEPSRELRPSKPDRAQSLGIGFVAGLMLGMCLACIREWTDRRLRRVRQVAELLGLPLLGLVPRSGGGSAVARGQAVRRAPLSRTAEAYRAIRTAVSHAGLTDSGCRILVTAPAAGAGVSTITSNLAISMAQAGLRVVVVDANLRDPVQHRIFEVSAGQGLAGVLTGEEPVEKAVARTTMEGLDVLCCGNVTGMAPEALVGPRMAEVLDRLSSRYDAVLLDTSPSVPFSDARALSSFCDAVLLVVRIGATDRREAMQARDGLVRMAANILGVIVNAGRSQDALMYDTTLPSAIAYSSESRPRRLIGREPRQTERSGLPAP